MVVSEICSKLIFTLINLSYFQEKRQKKIFNIGDVVSNGTSYLAQYIHVEVVSNY